MTAKLVLVLGGARSGKSGVAQSMAARAEEAGASVCFLATAAEDDPEMVERINHHRNSRPACWHTRELVNGTGMPQLPEGTTCGLLDCFTVLLSNLMARSGLDWPPEREDCMPENEVLERMSETQSAAMQLVSELRTRLDTLILVSNEVGQGVVPPYRLGRIFRDLAGRTNQALAAQADEVYLVTAGLPLCLKAPDKE